MKVVILAAGKGTRLFPLTQHVPKSLTRIAGIPIADRTFQALPDEITEAIIIVKYLKEKIISHVGDTFYGRPVRFVEQGDMPGTLGALFSAKALFRKGERFLVLNGDDIYDKNELQRYLEHDRALGVQRIIMPGYDSIHLTTHGQVLGMFPLTDDEKQYGALTATGAYVVDTDIFDHPGVQLPSGEFGLPHTLIAQKDTHQLYGVVTTKWMPVNTLSDIQKAEATLGQRTISLT